jgi:hypothetical protein
MAATTRPPVQPPGPQQRAAEIAQQLVAGLLTQPKTGTQVSARTWLTDKEYPLLTDVEFAMEELNSLLWSATNAGFMIACVENAGDMVPVVGIPANAMLDRAPLPSSVPFDPENLYRHLLGSMGTDVSVQWFGPANIPAKVLAPLTKFLTVRFQWIADNPTIRSLGSAASVQANNPYLRFTVHTQKSGLRIHYSKTFALNFNPVFGAPTTPKSGWILPGIHKFAGMDGNGNFLYDKGTFTTPPDFTAYLTI